MIYCLVDLPLKNSCLHVKNKIMQLLPVEAEIEIKVFS